MQDKTPILPTAPSSHTYRLHHAALCVGIGLLSAACADADLARADLEPDNEASSLGEDNATEDNATEDVDSDGSVVPSRPGGELDPTLVTDRGTGDICGSNDMIDVEDASSSIRAMADAVGSLEINFGGGTFTNCSGALVSENVFLTAGHCFDRSDINNAIGSNFGSQGALCNAMQVRFNFQNSGGTPAPNQPTFGCASILQSQNSNAFDYALIQLNGSPGQTFGFLETDFRRPVEDDPLTIIHHPAGMVKQVSTDVARSVGNKHIKHKADTQGGSSGAPIIMDGRIVGVHQRGGCSVPLGKNRGFTLERIFDDANWFQDVDYFDQNEEGVVESSDRFGSALAFGDFDGDGFDDVAVSAPNEDIGSSNNAGWISIREGGSRGLRAQSQFGFDQQGGTSSESGDYFGEVLATGDFNDDGFDDLAIGTPRENNGATSDSGVVHISMGGPGGLGTGSMQRFFPSNLSGSNSSGGVFGAALAVGDFNGDGFDDLAIGAPGQGNDGAVYSVFGSSTGLTTSGHDRFVQDDTGTNQSYGGGFGYALAAGDVDGDGEDDLLIGSPSEDIGSINSAGYVTVVPGRWSGLRLSLATGFEQSPGTGSEAGDRFGEVIVVGDFNNDGFDDAAFGLPHEDKGSLIDAGYMCIHHGGASGLTPRKAFSRSSLDGSSAAYDRLGEALAVGDINGNGRDDLVIGVPGDDTGAPMSGALFVAFGTNGGLSTSIAEELDITDVGTPTWLDTLGSAGTLATGDVDGDGDADVGAGLPQQWTSGAPAAGTVIVLDVD